MTPTTTTTAERSSAEATWQEVLDSLAAQIDLQEQALRHGSPPPVDLEIDPPSTPLTALERQRAIALFERCEELLDLAVARAADRRSGRRATSPYLARP